MTDCQPHWPRGWHRFSPENRRRQIASDRRVRRKAERLNLVAEKLRSGVGGWQLGRAADGVVIAGPGLFDWQLEDKLNARLAAREAAR